MSKSTRKTLPSDSSSSSDEAADGYEHDDFVVPDDYVDPVSDTESNQTKKRKKHRLRLRHTKRAGTELDPEDLELVAASQQIKAKDKDALEEALFSGTPTLPESDKPPTKRRKRDDSDSDDDFIEPEDGEILESTVEAGKGQVSTALSIFGATAVYTPKEQPTQPMAFEPSDIISRFATSEDDVVRVTDIPERMQAAFARRMHPTETELEAETDWLLKKIVAFKAPDNFQSLKTKLRDFLQMYRVEKFEVPYVATYRLHVLAPELTEADLWDLYRWDLDWAFLCEQKTKIAETLAIASKVAKDQALGRPPDARQKVLVTGSIPEDVNDLLTHSSPEEFISELSDLTQFCDIFVYTVKEAGGGKRVVSRKQMLSDARRNRLDEFALKAGLAPAHLVENLKAGKKVHWPPRTTQKPQDLAFEYMSGDYSEEFRVLHTVCMLMKGELAATPGFRAFVRKEYQTLMRVVTTPTERGKQALDIFHPAYRVKHLGHGKAADTFEGDLWAEVVKCEADGLIRADLKLPWADMKDDRILSKLKPFYLSDDAEDETEADWNGFRTEVLRHALTEVYEALATETRKVLMFRAEEFILQESRKKYVEMLTRPPYYRPEESTPIRVFAFVADPSTAKFGQVAVAALDSEGEVLDTALFTALIKGDKETFQPVDDDRHKTEKRNLQQMLLAQKPDVLVVAANCLHALQLRKVVAASARLMSEGFIETDVDWPVDQTTLLQRMPPVVMGDLQVAKLFADSHRGKRMFPDFSVLLRQAVSLGRSMQSPVSEALGLWMDPNENLTPMLKLHRLQRLIPEKQLLAALEEEAVKAACHRGADLNRMFDHPHLRSVLNFVAGLGPIKAHSVFERMVRSGHVFLRTELLTRQLVTKLVYQNSAGFVIIKAEDKSDPLDRTRIHPEHYDLAKKIAASALENARDEDESNVEKAMAQPKLVGEVDLDNYAAYLDTRGRKNMKFILELIVREFANPFHVTQAAFADMPGEEVLFSASGETPLTLRRGLMVQAYITSNSDGRVRCRLESGLDALVIADDAAVEKLHLGTSIRGRVLEVRVNVKDPETMFFNVKLSVRGDDLTDHVKFKEDIMSQARLDEAAFIIDDADWTEKSLMEDEHQLGQKYVPRVVSHPKYRNVGLKTACSELEQKDVGEFLIRPSSRGTDHLTCTLKFFDFVYCHLDVIEEGKPADNMLGTKFKIGDEAYESLQEIVERYVVPVTALTKEAVAHHKFKDITGHGLEYVETMLRAEKKAAPSSIPYYFTITPHYPQFLVLCYLPKDRIIREFIKVKPKGLFFHECYHPSINFLISWFKKHYSDATYQGQLARSKPPVITTENKFAVPGKVLTEVPQAPIAEDNGPKTPDRPVETPLRRTPGYGEMTPYNRTPHIGNQEWAGGASLKQTPRADDWEAERNFESFVPPTEAKPQEPKPPAPDAYTKPQPLRPMDASASAAAWNAPPQATSGGDAWGAAPSQPSQPQPAAAASSDSWGAPSTQPAASGDPWGGSSGGAWGGSATTATQPAASASSDAWGGAGGASGSISSQPAASASTDAWGGAGGASGGAWGSTSSQPPAGGDSWGGAATGGSWGSTTAATGGSWGSSGGASSGGSWGSGGAGGAGGGDRGRGGRGRGRGCFKCGEEGHMSKDCTKPGAGGSKACFRCHEEGHMSKDCPKGGGNGCFNCGKEGHMSKDCTEERKPRGGGGAGRGCFNCGKDGHMSKDCTEERKPRPGGGGKGCFNCGKEGHMSKDCTEERKPRTDGGNKSCFNCGKEGHMSKDCTEERKPRGDRRGGRGRRGGGDTHASTGGGWSGGGSSGWSGSGGDSAAAPGGWGNAQPSSSGGWGAPAGAEANTGGGWGGSQPTVATTSFESAWGGSSGGTSGGTSGGSAGGGADPWGAPAATPAQPAPSGGDAWGAPAATPATAPSGGDPWAANPWGGDPKPAETQPVADVPAVTQPAATQPAATQPADAWGGGGWGA